MRNAWIVGILGLLCLSAQIAFGQTLNLCEPTDDCVEKYAASLQFIVDEPVVNADGTAPDDLTKMVLYYAILDGAGAEGTAVKVGEVAMSSPAGGSKDVAFPDPVTLDFIATGTTAKVHFWAVAVDKAGNESDRSNVVVIKIDGIIPGAVTLKVTVHVTL